MKNKECGGAILLDKVKVKAGRMIRVHDKDKQNASKPFHVYIWVETADGKKEFPLRFTERAILAAKVMAEKNMEDWPKKTFITDLLD